MSGPLCKMKSREPGYEASFIPRMRTLPRGFRSGPHHSPLSSANPENAALSVRAGQSLYKSDFHVRIVAVGMHEILRPILDSVNSS